MAQRPDADDDGLSRYLGEVVPFHFDAPVLALSFAVSLIGAASTVELINRRTSRKGLYNYLLLLGSAITMGGVAIWCMHFIGNSATRFLDGQAQLQITYSIGITIASFFVPIFVLLLAFYIVSTSAEVLWWRIGVSGIVAGCSICGMHFIGNISISNYHCTYATINVVGAGIIAITASIVALSLFFVFRAAWTSTWWKRLGCSVVLAGAVSGMHWCAAVGTTFRLVHLRRSSESNGRNMTVIVVSCLSVASCLLIALLAISSARIRRGYETKAQKITLAAAYFDRHGRILVTRDGLLPEEEITATFMQKTQRDIFDTAHPLFHWIFQASRNWPTVSSLIPKMTGHLSQLPHHGRSLRSDISLVDSEGHIIDNYDTVFRELFCVAASTLAETMGERLEDAGVLWDEMFTTGGGQPRTSSEEARLGSAVKERVDLKLGQDNLAEKGMASTKKQRHGSLLFLVRKVEAARDVDYLEAAGFRFAELRQVVPDIKATMQIRASGLENRLRFMASYTEATLLDPGVHIGMFAARPVLETLTYEVLVREQAHNLLPSAWMPLDRLEPSHHQYLRRFHEKSLTAIRRELRGSEELSQQDQRFAAIFRDAIENLHGLIPDPILDEAIFDATPVQVPCRSASNTIKHSICSFLSFTLLLPPGTNVMSSKLRFTPLQFYKVQQSVNDDLSHSAAFARSVHRDIVSVLNAVPSVPNRSRLSPTGGRKGVHLHHRPTTSDTALNPSNDAQTEESKSTERMGTWSNPSQGSLSPKSGAWPPEAFKPVFKETVTDKGIFPAPCLAQESSFGGIMISSEVTVEEEEPDVIGPALATSGILNSSGQLRSPGRSYGVTNSDDDDGDDMPQDGHRVHSNHKSCPSKRGIELKTMPKVLGSRGESRVEVTVKKEDELATFVDILFDRCVDTATRGLDPR
ncbi:hypothetical protein B0T18DRAFT_131298 [Schizothecium vesticola]|uniref:MHYT domain-containing protein n=1 Tax=Schizothecium vesticola TaxID=314040 RepID=A0AA40F3P2_9PEZI|nr:hypothetical protein B0T18DRAFT_131298 [Schizothecium vesticola]